MRLNSKLRHRVPDTMFFFGFGLSIGNKVLSFSIFCARTCLFSYINTYVCWQLVRNLKYSGTLQVIAVVFNCDVDPHPDQNGSMDPDPDPEKTKSKKLKIFMFKRAGWLGYFSIEIESTSPKFS